ncbi:hypothetical protein CVT25_005639 [Psilocybe cyanescens]|uniref:Uncharacterized protein n=1 Tax=Psilocybe cyanescens TaxID=93625 RepID=A0A409X6D1_PSICY|nr:hypothetical protein CVT25_005639 [Psilocybe cyanescens]
MPAKPANPKGTLLLGYLQDGSEDQHLDVAPKSPEIPNLNITTSENPLASDFEIKKGFVIVKCPEVVERKQYIVALIGNSGNSSPPFRIKT